MTANEIESVKIALRSFVEFIDNEDNNAIITIIKSHYAHAADAIEQLQHELAAAKWKILPRCTQKAGELFKNGMYSGVVICSVEEWRGACNKEDTKCL